jgi:hypothetical protein
VPANVRRRRHFFAPPTTTHWVWILGVGVAGWIAAYVLLPHLLEVPAFAPFLVIAIGVGPGLAISLPLERFGAFEQSFEQIVIFGNAACYAIVAYLVVRLVRYFGGRTP